jgi:hypothetical protein
MTIRNMFWTLGIFYDHLVHLCSFGAFFPVLLSCTMKNLATLVTTRSGALLVDSREAVWRQSIWSKGNERTSIKLLLVGAVTAHNQRSVTEIIFFLRVCNLRVTYR